MQPQTSALREISAESDSSIDDVGRSNTNSYPHVIDNNLYQCVDCLNYNYTIQAVLDSVRSAEEQAEYNANASETGESDDESDDERNNSSQHKKSRHEKNVTRVLDLLKFEEPKTAILKQFLDKREATVSPIIKFVSLLAVIFDKP